uniref:MFS transporter n=1 Tax=Caldisericum exile TaxID=693075 RepID=A0A7C4XU58_9BACT
MRRKVSFAKIFIIGLGFFSISMLWSLYNTDVPIILQSRYHLSNYLTGWVMNLDNILAIILIPFIGALSDRTRTPIGKRMPFIITGLPLGALFFLLIPVIAYSTLPFVALFIVILFMNIAMAISRGPVIALMPDVVPSEERSPANGIINFMGGFGSLLVYFVLGKLSSVNRSLGFAITAVILVISTIILFFSVSEKRDSLYSESAEDESMMTLLKALFSKDNVFLIILLLSIFFWFVAFNSVETFYAVYMAQESGLSAQVGEQTAKFNLGIFSLVFMVFALPSGFIGKKLGRRRTILIGISGLILLFSVFTLIRTVSIQKYLFTIGGFFWSLININSLPMVLDLGTTKSQGTYTGFYYLFSQAANIIAPPLAGLVADRMNTRFVIFPFALVFFTFAFIAMLLVRGGEAKNESVGA